MADKYRTPAHQHARRNFQCVGCGHDLKNARYEGEYCFAYDKAGNEKFFAVFFTCRCGRINEVSMDLNDSFYDGIDDAWLVPHRAQKITTAPAMAETAEAT